MTVIEELETTVFWKHTTCNDPLNGCPRDFAEDYGLRIHRAVLACYVKGISQERINTACNRGYNRAMKSLGGGYDRP